MRQWWNEKRALAAAPSFLALLIAASGLLQLRVAAASEAVPFAIHRPAGCDAPDGPCVMKNFGTSPNGSPVVWTRQKVTWQSAGEGFTYHVELESSFDGCGGDFTTLNTLTDYAATSTVLFLPTAGTCYRLHVAVNTENGLVPAINSPFEFENPSGESNNGGVIQLTASSNSALAALTTAGLAPSFGGEDAYSVIDLSQLSDQIAQGTYFFRDAVINQTQELVVRHSGFDDGVTQEALQNGSGISVDVTLAAVDENGDGIPDVADTDLDGLLDAWEIEHFGDLSAGPTDDPDGDGFDNLAESRAGTDPSSGASAPRRLVVGTKSGGKLEQIDGFGDYPFAQTVSLNWPWYEQQGSGETRPALCDLDGDGTKELVIGMAPFPQNGGWVVIRDDAQAGYAVLQWQRLPWPIYNEANGETFPACGDIDGDGRDEIVIGLGDGGKGWVYLMDDALSGFGPLPGAPNNNGWLRTTWSEYFDNQGAIHPAVGDIDGDGVDEIVLGLGSSDAGGWVQLFDDAVAGIEPFSGSPRPFGWLSLDWLEYIEGHDGVTWPAVCDLDGDNHGEIVLGLDSGGVGWLRVFDSPGFAVAAGTPTAGGWAQIRFGAYNAESGATYPVCGDLDDDGKDELVIGVDSFPADGGWVEIREDLDSNLSHKAWVRLHDANYNATDGATRPAVE